MSGGEIQVGLLCAVAAGVGWFRWYWALLRSNRLAGGGWLRVALAVWPLLLLAGLGWLLRHAAAADVRDSRTYLRFYLLMGAAWLSLGRWGVTLFGVLWRDDALERRNPAATLTVCGALAGLLACYAGANIGDGPGWWCVCVAGGLATLTWYALAAGVLVVGGLSGQITVGRDLPAALRFAGYLVASGLLCGRGAAGDWTSAARTVIEFGAAWPVLLLAVAAGWIERSFRNRPLELSAPSAAAPPATTGSPGVAILLAALYLAFAVVAVYKGPPLPHNPAYDPVPQGPEPP